MKVKTKGLGSVIGFVSTISQFVVYLRAIIAAIESVKEVLNKAKDEEDEK